MPRCPPHSDSDCEECYGDFAEVSRNIIEYEPAHPDWCTLHERDITAETWRLYNRQREVYPKAPHLWDYCACGEEHVPPAELPANKNPRTKCVKPSDPDDSAEYWFFITLTQPDTNKDVQRIIKSTKKFIKSKQVQPLEWAYCLEDTQKKTPHSHIRLKTSKKYLDASKLKALNDNYRIEIQKEEHGSDKYIADESKAHSVDDWFVCSENYSGQRPSHMLEPQNSPATNEIIYLTP